MEMNMENMCRNCKKWCGCRSNALLVARIVLAVVFITHGASKLNNMGDVIFYFTNLFGGVGVLVAYFLAVGETLAGLSMLIGSYSRYGAWIIMFITLTAGLIKLSGVPGSLSSVFGTDFAIFALAFIVSSFGVGRWSMDHDKGHCGCGHGIGGNCDDGSCKNSWCNTCSPRQ